MRHVDARQRGGPKIAEISSAVGRTATWLGLVEAEAVALHSEHVKIILPAAAIFLRFQLNVVLAKENLTADLRLSLVRRASHAR